MAERRAAVGIAVPGRLIGIVIWTCAEDRLAHRPTANPEKARVCPVCHKKMQRWEITQADPKGRPVLKRRAAGDRGRGDRARPGASIPAVPAAAITAAARAGDMAITFPEGIMATVVYVEKQPAPGVPAQKWIVLEFEDGSLVAPNTQTGRCELWSPGDKYERGRQVPGNQFEDVYGKVLRGEM